MYHHCHQRNLFCHYIQHYTFGYNVTHYTIGIFRSFSTFCFISCLLRISYDPRAFMVYSRFSTAELHPVLSVCFLS